MSRGTGNLRQRIEVAPDARRFQFFNFVHSESLMNYRFKNHVLVYVPQR
jgi:hypothetical protein